MLHLLYFYIYVLYVFNLFRGPLFGHLILGRPDMCINCCFKQAMFLAVAADFFSYALMPYLHTQGKEAYLPKPAPAETII